MFPWVAGAFPADGGADQCTVANPDVDTQRFRMQNAIHRNGQIWCILTADPDGDGQVEVVWQDIADNSYPMGTPAVSQSGFINGTGTDPWTYMPSINVNAAGDAAIVYTQSSTTECPNMYYVSRLSTDPLGTFQAPVLARVSAGFYDSSLALNPERWGDYSAVVIDPSDDCFWMAQEFAFTSGVDISLWGTHIARFCPPPPPPGACCLWDGTCVDVADEAACTALAGSFQGAGTDCLTTVCPPTPQGANFFTDPAAFQAALPPDKRAKAAWNFKPNNVAAGTGGALDDPVNIAGHTGAGGIFDPWTDALGNDLWPPSVDNVTFQSNIGPNPQPPVPNPAGLNGLLFGNALAGYDNNFLVAVSFVHSFDILSGPPAVPPDNHTAMSFEIVASGPGPAGPVLVTVYDKNEVPVGKIKVDIVVNPPPGGPKKAFLGIIMKPGLTIGRVNLFDLGGGAEGISQITLYSDSPGILNTDISGPLGAGFPDGCVDAFDLGTLLGAWCSSASDPDPPGDIDPPCEGCTSPNAVLADLSGPVDGAPDGCVDAFDLAKLLAAWCSVAGGNPCGTCFP